MNNINKESIQSYLVENRNSIIKDIGRLVRIESVMDKRTSGKNKPFGNNVRKVFDEFIEIANENGLMVEDFEGYALHMQIGDGDEMLGILGHLDIVNAYDIEKWEGHPFEILERDGLIYGRGVNDNKGPVIGIFYAMLFLMKQKINFKRRIRLILGGAEETTWECMKYYFEKNAQPTLGFSPDGNFPIVNGEKGILYLNFKKNLNNSNESENEILSIKSSEEDGYICNYIEVTYKTKNIVKLIESMKYYTYIEVCGDDLKVYYITKKIVSRNPDRGENAAYRLGKDLKRIDYLGQCGENIKTILEEYFVDDFNGEKMGIYSEDIEMGKTTMSVMNISYEEKELNISFDIRYPKSIKKEFILNQMKKVEEKFLAEVSIYKDLKMLYVEPESSLIEVLSKSYEKVFKEKAELITKGAASYARVLENGVAFGPTISGEIPNSHGINEKININNFFKAIEVYIYAIYDLACK